MGVMIQSLQQLTGDNYFFYYGTTIFKSVGLKDSFQTSIIIGGQFFLFVQQYTPLRGLDAVRVYCGVQLLSYAALLCLPPSV
nr:ASN_HP1_G0046710.mRNA.1.CDS.1 [Saccharomyces cerevisiae]